MSSRPNGSNLVRPIFCCCEGCPRISQQRAGSSTSRMQWHNIPRISSLPAYSRNTCKFALLVGIITLPTCPLHIFNPSLDGTLERGLKTLHIPDIAVDIDDIRKCHVSRELKRTLRNVLYESSNQLIVSRRGWFRRESFDRLALPFLPSLQPSFQTTIVKSTGIGRFRRS